jgi:phage tail-like protein
MPMQLGRARHKGQRSTSPRAADPPYAGRFHLTVGGLHLGSFMEVSGLAVTVEVEDLAEGGHNGYVHHLPGRMKWPNLVLKRGITDNDELFAWLSRTSGDGFAGSAAHGAKKNHAIVPLDGSISVCDSTLTVVRTWAFTHAFPVRWTGPKLAASSNELATEELEICHRGFTSAPR